MREGSRKEGGGGKYDRRCLRLSRDEIEALEREGKPWAVRFKVPEGTTVVHDLIRGEITFDNSSIEDFVLLRRDGTATYNLAVVVDDMGMGITDVVRGDDHLPNTPKQVLLYRALGQEPPRFAHLPMIVGKDGKPLSKRHGDVAIGRYRELGFLPEAMVNYLALLGWSLDDSTTLISREELIANFGLSRVSSKPATWDTDKLIWMNGKYIMGLPDEDLIERISPFLEEKEIIKAGDPGARETLGRILPLIRERLKLLSDAPALTAFFFKDVSPEIGSLDILHSREARRMLELVRLKLTTLDPFVTPTIEEVLRETANSLGLKPREAFQPIRVAITGSKVSPPLFESMEILGRQRCLERLDRALELSEEVST
jgi:glutamyl-tRNA synthetase